MMNKAPYSIDSEQYFRITISRSGGTTTGPADPALAGGFRASAAEKSSLRRGTV
jgi:hypothetical protein